MTEIGKKRITILVVVIAYLSLSFFSYTTKPRVLNPNKDTLVNGVSSTANELIVLIDEELQLSVFPEIPIGLDNIDPHLLFREKGSVEDYTVRLGDELSELDSFHIVVHGYGAAIAFRFYQMYPGKVQSILLQNPKGLVEFEPLGSEIIARSLRTVQSIGFSIWDSWIPFSWKLSSPQQFDRWNARIVSRSNLSMTRQDTRNLSIPVAIVKGHDVDQSAREFYRIIPHSVWIEDLNAVWNRSGTFSPDLSSPERIAKSVVPYFDLNDQKLQGSALLVAMVLIALSTLISEDLACIGSGILVSQGGIGFLSASVACFGGIFLGDMLLFLSGRVFGEVLIRKRPFRWIISPDALVSSERWFKEKGLWVLVVSRFMPGSRVPVFFAAGALKTKTSLVSLILATAALIWVPMLVFASVFLGQRILEVFGQYEKWALLGVVVVFSCILITTHKLLPLLTYRGRRLAWSKIIRLFRWEFWPAKAIYPPVVAYIFYQSIKDRCLSIFTVVNPMIPCGGLVDESKSEILCRLKEVGAPVGDYTCIDANNRVSENVAHILSCMDEWGCPFPLVLKPDLGERGKNVCIVKTSEELRVHLENVSGTYIVQRYIGGQEFGVLYYRIPGCENGKVSSITRKQYTSVVGNGVNDLEHLILSDKRAVCCATAFLRAHKERIFDIPKKGEVVKLVEIGTHSRGSLFLDAGDLLSDELISALDTFCRPMKGFYYGRFDLKVPDDQSLLKGKNIEIIELNLLTSEPTHIYDPSHSLLFAWKTLLKHWQIVFEISRKNREKGHQPLGVGRLFKLIMRHYF